MSRSGLTPPEVGAILVELMTISHSRDIPNGREIGAAIDRLPPEVQRDALLQAVGMLHAANNTMSEITGRPVSEALQLMGLEAARQAAQ